MGTRTTMGETDPSTEPDETVERQQWLDRKREQVESEQANGWHRGLFSGPSDASTHAPAWEQRHWTSRALQRVGGIAAHSGAGIVAALLVVMWASVGLVVGFP